MAGSVQLRVAVIIRKVGCCNLAMFVNAPVASAYLNHLVQRHQTAFGLMILGGFFDENMNHLFSLTGTTGYLLITMGR